MVIKKDWKYFCILISALVSLNTYAQIPENPPVHHDRPDSLITIPDSAKIPLHTVPPGKDTLTASPKTVSPLIIGNISIIGNRKTKNYIILRELSFKRGDLISLAELVKSFQLAHDRLINTRLFNEVTIYLKGFRGYTADIEIDVKERWYIFPLPYFKPVDRNFTAWAQKHYDLNRVNYGAKFTHYNFTGRNDNLTAWLITGYARQFQLYYNQPYADKSLKHGFGLGFSYAQQKELDVLTVNNQQTFINADTIPTAGKYLNEQLSFSVRYFYRPGLKVRHTLGLNLINSKIDSSVLRYCPQYFNNGRKEIFYPELTYRFNYTDVDYIAYPLNGIVFDAGLLHRGFNPDINLWQLNIRLIRSWKLANKTWFGFQNTNMLKLPLHQPFYNQPLIGYNDMYLRGLDRYVIDGTAGFVFRNTLYRELFNFNIPFMHNYSHDHIPIRIYATAFSDYGYSYNSDFKGNSLVNRMLYTAGFGIDLVTFYDLNFRFDYGFNQLGQNGLFLHIRNDF
jgi:outer membrane protein assembly factor BamA